MTLLPDAVPAEASPSGPGATAGGWRAVEVAVDAAGRGGDRTYTYLVPDALADLEPGEAVLVEFGRRQALGIVIAEATELPPAGAKPLVDRVRADGPLLPRLTLALASAIASALPGAAGPRAAGDAAARACSNGLSSSPS